MIKKNWIKILVVVISITLSIWGMIHVSTTFPFFSDEQHLFEDSLWVAGDGEIESKVNVRSLYSGYFELHYPERGAHPNGIVLILGGYIWILKVFRELTLPNLLFFVMAIRILMIGAVLISLYFLYLIHKEMDEAYGKWTGILAVSFAALFPPLVAYGGIRAMDTLSLLSLMICLWSVVRLMKSDRPSFFMWLIPGLSAGIFLILKSSGLLVIPVIFIYGLFFSRRWDWMEIGKKTLIPIGISIATLVITNNPYLYFRELLSPTLEFQNAAQNIFASFGIRKFGFLGFQVAKLWEMFHPDYYLYLGFHRHASPGISLLDFINKHLTLSFLILWVVSIIILLILKKWKEAILFNVPLVILVLSLPVFASYRLLPVIPLFLSTPVIAYVTIINKYPDTRIRLFITFIALFMFFTPSLSYFRSSQVVDGETYLDMADIASHNRHLTFVRGIFYDRELIKWKADRLDKPFALMPLDDGVLRTEISFKRAGEYWIDFLIGSQTKGMEFQHELEVELGERVDHIKILPNTKGWYSAGPFFIGPDRLQQELFIKFSGISEETSGGRNWFSLNDIRILESEQKKSEESNGYVPEPWWITARIN